MVNDKIEVRVIAALAVCRIDPKNKTALKAIIASLQDDSEGIAVQLEAARALSQLGQSAEPALDALLQALKHREERLHWGAIRAIQAIGGKKAVQILDSALLHASTRDEAAESLGKLGPISAPAAPKLVKLLGKAKATIRHTRGRPPQERWARSDQQQELRCRFLERHAKTTIDTCAKLQPRRSSESLTGDHIYLIKHGVNGANLAVQYAAPRSKGYIEFKKK